MKVVLQRVIEASVAVDDRTVASIGKGLLLFIGIEKGDTAEMAESVAGKVCRLRVFEDTEGKMNLDIRQVAGEVLSVPQFTLVGDISKGNRPGFDNAAPPERAVKLWQKFNDAITVFDVAVAPGEFGAHMNVSLVNDGPVTFIVDPDK